MKARHLVAFLVISAACPMGSRIHAAGASSPLSDEPLLTLEDALSLALDNNRLVKISALEADKSEDQMKVARSRRLPQFHFDVLAGSLLHPFDFTFPAGSFGTYPGVGEIPATEAKIETPAQFTTFITAAIDQPLTQQYKIKVGIQATALGHDIAREDLRAERQKVAAGVRSAYFNLVAAQAAVDAAREAVKTLEETRRVTADYESEKAVLHADALEVDARLAKSRYDLSAAGNRLATQRELLNDLLGRDLTTAFRVEPLPEQEADDLTLESARQRAAENRPEIRQADLRAQQADCDRRLARAEYIPDLSLSVRYVGFANVEVLPRNVTTAGLYLSWEPFDWRRRHYKVEEKSKSVEQARQGAQQVQSQIAIEVGAAYRKWSEMSLLVQAARTGYEAAKEQLRVTADRYREQASLVKDLLQAQARSTEADFQYQQALSSYWSALAELRRAMGDE